jgi:integrase
MRLQYRPAGGKAQSLMLPFDFEKRETSKALRRIEEIFKNFVKAKGTKTLSKAATVTETSSSKHQINWEELVNNYRQFVPNASDKTWKKSYIPVLTKAGLLMNRSKGKPQDGESLMLEALKQWEQGTRSRQIARRSLKGFLEWAVLRGKLIAAYAPPAHIPETRNPSEIGYAIADQEIIELLDLIPKGRTASEEEIYNSWRFAIQLCSVYGLRPEELRHLTIKEGIEGKELWTTYQKSKGGKKGDRTEPRKLHALFVRDLDGNPLDWSLQKRFAIGEKLPPLGSLGQGGLALGTFLKRRKYWNQLREVVKTTKKESLKAYSFRHRYAKQSHAQGFPVANIAAAMGHTVEVHLQNYARFTPDATTDLYAKSNQVKAA